MGNDVQRDHAEGEVASVSTSGSMRGYLDIHLISGYTLDI